MCLQDKEKTLEEATQAALEASSAAEAQHAIMSKQLAADRRNLQDQLDQVLLLSTNGFLPIRFVFLQLGIAFLIICSSCCLGHCCCHFQHLAHLLPCLPVCLP